MSSGARDRKAAGGAREGERENEKVDGQKEREGGRERVEEDGVCPVDGCRCALGWAQHEDADMGDPCGSIPLYSKELRPCS